MFKLTLGFVIVLLIKIKDLDKRLNQGQIKVFYFFVFVYPFIELFFKSLTQYWFTSPDTIHYQLYINIIEHLLAGMAVAIVLYPFIEVTMEKLSVSEKFILFVPMVTFFCLLYELIGFYFYYQPMGFLGGDQYADSMRDLTLNIVGTIILFKIIISCK